MRCSVSFNARHRCPSRSGRAVILLVDLPETRGGWRPVKRSGCAAMTAPAVSVPTAWRPSRTLPALCGTDKSCIFHSIPRSEPWLERTATRSSPSTGTTVDPEFIEALDAWSKTLKDLKDHPRSKNSCSGQRWVDQEADGVVAVVTAGMAGARKELVVYLVRRAHDLGGPVRNSRKPRTTRTDRTDRTETATMIDQSRRGHA